MTQISENITFRTRSVLRYTAAPGAARQAPRRPRSRRPKVPAFYFFKSGSNRPTRSSRRCTASQHRRARRASLAQDKGMAAHHALGEHPLLLPRVRTLHHRHWCAWQPPRARHVACCSCIRARRRGMPVQPLTMCARVTFRAQGPLCSFVYVYARILSLAALPAIVAGFVCGSFVCWSERPRDALEGRLDIQGSVHAHHGSAHGPRHVS